MKTFFLGAFIIACYALTNTNLYAQPLPQSLTLQFLPYMGATPMVLGETTATDNNGTPYIISRAQFYVSNIELIHDGGQILPLTNTYLLVNANQTNYPIGEYAINTLEAVRFKVGIDATTNHADPTLYPSGHPLALQTPSMHWGWAGGYRFVALEGQTADASSSFQYHALGDEFLTSVEVPLNLSASSTGITAPLYTDYAKFMEGLYLMGNVHGGGHFIEVLMSNIQNGGITSDVPTSTILAPSANNIAYNTPNPFAQQTTLHYQYPNAQNIGIAVYDMTGSLVYKKAGLSAVGNLSLSLPSAALYTYLLYDQNQQIIGKGKMLSQ
jgi:hypothetical protein